MSVINIQIKTKCIDALGFTRNLMCDGSIALTVFKTYSNSKETNNGLIMRVKLLKMNKASINDGRR